ncbi:hypothetical protein SEMRO_3293_G346300.1 [Seminavis robusta]|uniref:Uncharacterized protein n=1 Tax=Seminavis robusta TaxID=568900 RepID=A0A9N8F3W9_9STRA|nr:hypothetical protein SEMRO_3293_G346300.1 [Seminavis robusta]|eukprot:Sro3293_g346300.1 n/a (288) ;mRNA; r:3346-4330
MTTSVQKRILQHSLGENDTTTTSNSAGNYSRSSLHPVGVKLGYDEFFSVFAASFEFHLASIVQSISNELNMTNTATLDSHWDKIRVTQAISKLLMLTWESTEMNGTMEELLTVASLVDEQDIQEYEELGPIDQEEILRCLDGDSLSSAQCSLILEGVIAGLIDSSPDSEAPIRIPAFEGGTQELDSLRDGEAEPTSQTQPASLNPSPQPTSTSASTFEPTVQPTLEPTFTGPTLQPVSSLATSTASVTLDIAPQQSDQTPVPTFAPSPVPTAEPTTAPKMSHFSSYN